MAQKLQILNLLKSGEKIASIARKFDFNESTMRSIRDNEKKIRETASQLGKHAKVCKIARGGKIIHL